MHLDNEHLDRAIGRYFWFAETEMYSPRNTPIPPAGCVIEDGDF